jgi:hypothetical protein
MLMICKNYYLRKTNLETLQLYVLSVRTGIADLFCDI